ncbi:MAG: AAA family ATPase [Pseudohongiella sp.]|nr:AAA family ATPase [Pseudohongiella sp.]MDO9521964.1 AAA family ATPase [Pseudohongiella sp.]
MTAIEQEPPVLFLFGLSGAGKSYVGDLISVHTGWPVYHADIDITPQMRQALADARPFTDAMRDDYFARLPGYIQAHRQAGLPLIVTQGAYKRRHRNELKTRIPGLEPIWVDAPPELIIQRLEQRGQGIRAASAAALFSDFEAPADTHIRIVNDGDKNRVLQQCRACITAFP